MLVIHGMGQQDPFDTLDDFASALIKVIQAEAQSIGVSVAKHHRLLDRGTWNENYISLALEGRDSPPIDIYEYYWAHEAQREITGSEVFQWLVQIGMLARKYYEDNDELAKTYEQKRDEAFGKQFLFFGRPVFKKYWYLKYAGVLLRLTQAALAVADPLLGHFLPQAGKPLKIIGGVVGRFIGDKVADSFGDVVLYTTTDQKSRRYQVRQRILEGAVTKVRQLLTSPDPEAYGRVILAGHSLGSVIAYDALNRINHAMNVEPALAGKRWNLTGLVTFGSPLDKIAFFLRSRARDDQHIKRQIQANYHSFRAKNWSPSYQPPAALALRNDIKPFLDHIKWLNFWDPKDPISGELDFYRVEYPSGSGGNRPLDLEKKTPWEAHTGYWKHRKMYERMVEELL